MEPTLIVFAVRAFIRLGRTAVDVANQKALDQPFLMPVADVAKTSRTGMVEGRARQEPFKTLIQPTQALHEMWTAFENETDEAKKEKLAVTLYTAMRAIADRDQKTGGSTQVTDSAAKENLGAVMIMQWGQGEGPPDPLARVIVTIADIALEYVGSNPSIVGVGGQGEVLVGALAKNLSALLPDAVGESAYGPKDEFGQRLVGLFLHAGLKTITDKPDLVFGEEHLQNLVKASLVPVRDKLPNDITKNVEWHAVAEALTGPAVNIALATVGSDPKAFLGKGFDKDTAVGASVAALLMTASEIGLKDLSNPEKFSKEGWIALFQSVAAVAAKRPDLFIGKPGKDPEVIAQNVFVSVAEAIAEAPSPFKGDLGLQITIAALEGIEDSLGEVFDNTDAWETLAGSITGQILEGLKTGFAAQDGQPLTHAFSREQWISFARLFAAQAAKSPDMIAGGDKKLQAVVKNVGAALKDAKPPFDKEVGIALTESVLTGLANAAPEVFDQTDPWETVAGKIVQQIITGVKDGVGDGQPLDQLLSEEQWIGFVHIFAEQATKTPEMVTGQNNEKLKVMVEEAAKALAAAKPPYESGYGVALAQSVFTGLANASPRVFDQTDGWERVAGRITAGVMSGIAEGFGAGGIDPLKSVLSRDQFVDFGRILAEEVARTPDMIVGREDRVKAIVQAIAAAMAADTNLLLTASDWHRILAVAAEEAARNPDRLFKIDTVNPGGQVATILIRKLLEASADGLVGNKRNSGRVLFGPTLVDAITTTLRAAAGNVSKALASAEAVMAIARDVDRIVEDNAGAYGSKEWLRVFKHYLPSVIESGNTPTLTADIIENILKERSVSP